LWRVLTCRLSIEVMICRLFFTRWCVSPRSRRSRDSSSGDGLAGLVWPSDSAAGPVPLLVCHHGRIFGGLRTVFALEPAADDNVKSLGVAARSPLCALAVSGTHIWAVESSEPTVHVVRSP
jgi:hypothetical protein